jgi:hypothetical protein
MTQLTILNLSNNELTVLPTEIYQLTQLIVLSLDRNKLTFLPKEIGQMNQLRNLGLTKNYLTAIPTTIGKLTRLHTLDLDNNKLTHLPVEIGQLIQLTSLGISGNQIENILNPIIQRQINRIRNIQLNITNGNTIYNVYNDAQNVHSSSIQQSIRNSIHNLMNEYIINYHLAYLDWSEITQQTKEIITEFMDCTDIHTMLNVTFKELFTAVVIEMNCLSLDEQKEIRQRLNEEMQDANCRCFTGRISRLVNCLSGYSDKVKIQITETEEIGNIISVIMNKRGIKTIEMLKEEVILALKERGYNDEIISMWLEHVE